jgi:UDP-glucose 6-dehydrogenase
MIIGIIGNGFVGQATQLFKSSLISEIYIYDIIQEKCYPKTLNFNDLSKCNLLFICLPTPSNANGSCNISYINNTLEELAKIIDKELTHIVIRSTIPPKTCAKLSDKYKIPISFLPEFLTEKNWKEDFINTKCWILGTNNYEVEHKMKEILNCAFNEEKIKSNKISIVSSTEAEIIKYTRNAFLATKVSFFNEIYSYCNSLNIDYNIVREIVVLDDRIGRSHTEVPGYDGKYGYGGTCLPKDTRALSYEMKNNGLNPIIINSVIERNEQDRPDNLNGERSKFKNFKVTGIVAIHDNDELKKICKEKNIFYSTLTKNIEKSIYNLIYTEFDETDFNKFLSSIKIHNEKIYFRKAMDDSMEYNMNMSNDTNKFIENCELLANNGLTKISLMFGKKS